MGATNMIEKKWNGGRSSKMASSSNTIYFSKKNPRIKIS